LSNSSGFVLAQDGGGGITFHIFKAGGGGAYTLLSSTGWQLDTPYFIAATFDGSTMTIYRNGNAVATRTDPVDTVRTVLNPTLQIGRNVVNNSHWNGQIDEVRFYDHALAPEEVAALVSGPGPTGLISWWRAENNATDSVGPHHGTLQNGAAFAPGKVGQAFSLNGANQYVVIGDPVPPSLQIQNEITLSAWIYVTEYPASGTLGLIIGSQYDAQQAGATIFLDGRTSPDGQPAPPGHIHFQIGDGSWHTANANAQIPLNQWVHVATTRKANEDAKIYYNGVLQPSTSVPWSGAISYSGAWFAIGQQKDLNRPFRGLIDEARIYDHALTPAEVTALMTGPGP
jgi:hypothetical protein